MNEYYVIKIGKYYFTPSLSSRGELVENIFNAKKYFHLSDALEITTKTLGGELVKVTMLEEKVVL